MICSKFNKLFSIILVIFVSSIFFSCATSPKGEKSPSQNVAPDVSEETENNNDNTADSTSLSDIDTDIDTETISNKTNSINDSTNLFSSEATSENSINKDNNEIPTKSENDLNQIVDLENSEINSFENISEFEKTDISQDTYSQLTEIEEPEVIELEPPEEDTQENIGTDNISEIFDDEVLEIVDEEDLITPELSDYDSNNSVDSEDNINSENANIEEVNNDTNLTDTTNTETNDSKNTTSEALETISTTDDKDNDSNIDSNDISTEIEKISVPEIIISRSITMKKLEYLDVTYPGKGWIFMGLTDNSKDLTYFGRKVGTNDTKFSLQAKNSGTKILHFYKNDTLTNEYIDDYFEVIILEEKGSNKTRIEAPKYVPPLKQEKNTEVSNDNTDDISDINNITDIKTSEKLNNEPQDLNAKPINVSNENSSTKSVNEKKSEKNYANTKKGEIINYEDDEVITLTETNSESSSESLIEETESLHDPDELYKDALQYFNDYNYKNAEEKLLLGLQAAITGKDKFLFLLGQLYEVESDIQNINKAIDEYSQLINNYPASSYWDKANKRIIYLKRFYIEGR